MSTKQFMTLENLTTYDGLIKQYIGTEDAKSIKSLTVSGNTVSFYKTADASGIAAYTVNMPDVSGFMEKIEDAEGGKIVVSNSDGSVSESDIDLSSVATIESSWNTGYYLVETTSSGNIQMSTVETSRVLQTIDGATGDKVIISNSDGSISESYLDADDLVYSIDELNGYGLLLACDDGRRIQASQTTIDDLATKDFIGDIPQGASSSTIVDYISEAIDDASDDYLSKGSGWHGDKVIQTNSDGTISETTIDIPDGQDKFLTGYFGGGQDYTTILVNDGEYGVTASDITINDIATQDDLADKMDIIGGASGDQIVISNSDGSVSESGYGIGDFLEYDETIEESSGYFIAYSNSYSKGYRTDFSTEMYESVCAAVNGFDDQNTIADAIADAAADADISLVEAQTPTTGYLKTYELYQGGNAAANLVGKIDIPKDLVVTSGEIVVNPAGQPAGTYLKLTIANQTTPVYINVADLADVYTAASGATQVQLAISATNEISATLVAGGVGTTELASNAVTTAKIADDAVTADKVSIAAHSEIQTAAAANGNVALTVTTTDGQVSAVSASIPANTYDAYGAASGVQTALVGTSSDPASADTINGAKAYADAATASIPTSSIEALFA